MPYNKISELPPAVKKLTEHKQKVWLSAFNSAFKQSQNEEQAFKIAWAAVEKLKEENTSIIDQDIFEALTVDAEKKRAHVVIIKEGWSKNKRYYPAQVLEQAVPLFEGAKCYLDHSDIKGIPNRSVRELTGFYENVKFAGKQVEADLQFLDTEAGKVGLDIAKETVKHNKLLAGLSIRGIGTMRKVEEGHEVENLSKIISVDMVSDPAAGGEFLRLYESVMEVKDEMKDLTLEKLKEERPDLVQSISEEVESRVYGKKGELDKQLKEIKEQNDKLAKDIAEWKTYGQVKETETILEKELAKSELPDIAKERIRKLYTGKIAKVEEITESIKSEKEYIAKIAENKQVNVGNSGKDSEVKEQNKEKYEAKLKEVYEAMGYSEKEVEDLLKIKRGK
jgi:cation transport regulator ChaB